MARKVAYQELPSPLWLPESFRWRDKCDVSIDTLRNQGLDIQVGQNIH